MNLAAECPCWVEGNDGKPASMKSHFLVGLLALALARAATARPCPPTPIGTFFIWKQHAASESGSPKVQILCLALAAKQLPNGSKLNTNLEPIALSLWTDGRYSAAAAK